MDNQTSKKKHLKDMTPKELREYYSDRFKAQNEYTKTLYDRINITVPKGYKAEIQKAAAAQGMSVNAFCSKLIQDGTNSINHPESKEDYEIPECFR